MIEPKPMSAWNRAEKLLLIERAEKGETLPPTALRDALVEMMEAEAYWRIIVKKVDAVKYQGFECRFCGAFNLSGPVKHIKDCPWLLAQVD